MEDNFIQMAASAGHEVAYTIGLIFKHLACRRNTYLWWDPTNNNRPTVSNRSSKGANDISSATDNAIFKIRAQNIACSFGLKLNVANILHFNCSEQKFVQYGPIAIAIDCNGLSLLIFEEKWPKW